VKFCFYLHSKFLGVMGESTLFVLWENSNALMCGVMPIVPSDKFCVCFARNI
jgi:hypothetical protein